MLTLMRGLLAGVAVLYRATGPHPRHPRGTVYAAQGLVAAGFIAFMLALPRLAPNPYASGKTYHRYLDDARRTHPVIAHVLDWAVDVQPVIYRFGMNIRRAAEGK